MLVPLNLESKNLNLPKYLKKLKPHLKKREPQIIKNPMMKLKMKSHNKISLEAHHQFLVNIVNIAKKVYNFLAMMISENQ